MFTQLTNFSYKRNKKEAFGFYLAYFFLALIIGACTGAMLNVTSTPMTFQEGFDAGMNSSVLSIVTMLYVAIISVLVLVKRGLQHKFLYIVLVGIACFLSIFGGALLGLIIPAVMTTKEVHGATKGV
jgi:hypothetical protein